MTAQEENYGEHPLPDFVPKMTESELQQARLDRLTDAQRDDIQRHKDMVAYDVRQPEGFFVYISDLGEIIAKRFAASKGSLRGHFIRMIPGDRARRKELTDAIPLPGYPALDTQYIYVPNTPGWRDKVLNDIRTIMRSPYAEFFGDKTDSGVLIPLLEENFIVTDITEFKARLARMDYSVMYVTDQESNKILDVSDSGIILDDLTRVTVHVVRVAPRGSGPIFTVLVPARRTLNSAAKKGERLLNKKKKENLFLKLHNRGQMYLPVEYANEIIEYLKKNIEKIFKTKLARLGVRPGADGWADFIKSYDIDESVREYPELMFDRYSWARYQVQPERAVRYCKLPARYKLPDIGYFSRWGYPTIPMLEWLDWYYRGNDLLPQIKEDYIDYVNTIYDSDDVGESQFTVINIRSRPQGTVPGPS